MRPEESLLANTRLFFGVYEETLSQNSKSGYRLKVVYIVTSRLKKTPLIQNRSNRCHRDVSYDTRKTFSRLRIAEHYFHPHWFSSASKFIFDLILLLFCKYFIKMLGWYFSRITNPFCYLWLSIKNTKIWSYYAQ